MPSFLVPAILWLIRGILESLTMGGELDAWIRQAGLADDAEGLRSEIKRVSAAVSAASSMMEGRPAAAALSEPSLAALREALYDADDMVDDLDYCRLQQHVMQRGALCDVDTGFIHGADGASTDGDTDMPSASSSSGKQRRRRFEVSKHLDHFITGEVKETHMDKREQASHHQLPNPSRYYHD